MRTKLTEFWGSLQGRSQGRGSVLGLALWLLSKGPQGWEGLPTPTHPLLFLSLLPPPATLPSLSSPFFLPPSFFPSLLPFPSSSSLLPPPSSSFLLCPSYSLCQGSFHEVRCPVFSLSPQMADQAGGSPVGELA